MSKVRNVMTRMREGKRLQAWYVYQLLMTMGTCKCIKAARRVSSDLSPHVELSCTGVV